MRQLSRCAFYWDFSGEVRTEHVQSLKVRRIMKGTGETRRGLVTGMVEAVRPSLVRKVGRTVGVEGEDHDDLFRMAYAKGLEEMVVDYHSEKIHVHLAENGESTTIPTVPSGIQDLFRDNVRMLVNQELYNVDLLKKRETYNPMGIYFADVRTNTNSFNILEMAGFPFNYDTGTPYFYRPRDRNALCGDYITSRLLASSGWFPQENRLLLHAFGPAEERRRQAHTALLHAWERECNESFKAWKATDEPLFQAYKHAVWTTVTEKDDEGMPKPRTKVIGRAPAALELQSAAKKVKEEAKKTGAHATNAEKTTATLQAALSDFQRRLKEDVLSAVEKKYSSERKELMMGSRFGRDPPVPKLLDEDQLRGLLRYEEVIWHADFSPAVAQAWQLMSKRGQNEVLAHVLLQTAMKLGVEELPTDALKGQAPKPSKVFTMDMPEDAFIALGRFATLWNSHGWETSAALSEQDELTQQVTDDHWLVFGAAENIAIAELRGALQNSVRMQFFQGGRTKADVANQVESIASEEEAKLLPALQADALVGAWQKGEENKKVIRKWLQKGLHASERFAQDDSSMPLEFGFGEGAQYSSFWRDLFDPRKFDGASTNGAPEEDEAAHGKRLRFCNSLVNNFKNKVMTRPRTTK